MIPLSAVEGTATTACVRSPRFGEFTAGISGVAKENERNNITNQYTSKFDLQFLYDFQLFFKMS